MPVDRVVDPDRAAIGLFKYKEEASLVPEDLVQFRKCFKATDDLQLTMTEDLIP